MSIELLPGGIEIRSANGNVGKFSCLYNSGDRKVVWVCFEGGSTMTWEKFQECIQGYMDLPDEEKEDGDLLSVILVKMSCSSDMCVPENLFKKIPKYPHELVQQTLAVCK